MDKNFHVRWGWLKAMYLYTLIGAGGIGFAMVFFPEVIQSALGYSRHRTRSSSSSTGASSSPRVSRHPGAPTPPQVHSPSASPVDLQADLVGRRRRPDIPKGEFPLYVVMFSAIFLTYIIGDLIAIPFSYLFSRE